MARSTFRSQNVQSTWCSDHFWKLRCRKSARRCGAKHISKSKCQKHQGFGPLLEKNACLWREAHFEVKMLNTPCSDHFWRFRYRFAWQAQGIVHLVKSEQKLEGFVAFPTTTTATPHYTPIHYTTLQLQLQLHLHYILLHYTPLHYTALNYTQSHYIHYTTTTTTPSLHSTTLHSTTLHSITLNRTTLHYTPLHYH